MARVMARITAKIPSVILIATLHLVHGGHGLFGQWIEGRVCHTYVNNRKHPSQYIIGSNQYESDIDCTDDLMRHESLGKSGEYCQPDVTDQINRRHRHEE